MCGQWWVLPGLLDGLAGIFVAPADEVDFVEADCVVVLVTDEMVRTVPAWVEVAAEATPTAPAPSPAESRPVRMSRRALVAVMVAKGYSLSLGGNGESVRGRRL